MKNTNNMKLRIQLTKNGLTEKNIADYLGVSYTTIRNRFRYEMTDTDKGKYLKIIATLSKQKAQHTGNDKKVPQSN